MWRKRSVTISTTRSHRKQPRRTVPSSREPIPLSYARFVTDRSSRSFSLPLCPFLSISPILAPIVVGCYYIVLNPFFSLCLLSLAEAVNLLPLFLHRSLIAPPARTHQIKFETACKASASCVLCSLEYV